jgi:hypothetical protein
VIPSKRHPKGLTATGKIERHRRAYRALEKFDHILNRQIIQIHTVDRDQDIIFLDPAAEGSGAARYQLAHDEVGVLIDAKANAHTRIAAQRRSRRVTTFVFALKLEHT